MSGWPRKLLVCLFLWTTITLASGGRGKVCRKSMLPDLFNADYQIQDVPVGGSVIYTCRAGYKLSPKGSRFGKETQKVTCQPDGTFTALKRKCIPNSICSEPPSIPNALVTVDGKTATYTCVTGYRLKPGSSNKIQCIRRRWPMFNLPICVVQPKSCRDYFARDNLFAAASMECTTITVDPQGPGTSDPNNPDPSQVQCCKTSATQYCTQVFPSSGTKTATTANPCNGTAPDVLLPTTPLDGTRSGRCDSTVAVDYPITNTQIEDMISSAKGSCSQVTSINCGIGADSLGVAVRVNGEQSGVMYGTSVFANIGPGPGGLGVTNNAYAGGACDCGRTQEASDPVVATNCPSTCRCTTIGPAIAANTDTITKALVTPNPAFVTHYQILQHGRDRGGVPAVTVAPNDMTVSIGPIQCCETF